MLDGLTDEQLATMKIRSEVEKLRLEMQEMKAWRAKLIFTSLVAVLAPIGSVLLFLYGWYGSHAVDRHRQNQDVYQTAAKQLASPFASVRLSAVLTLDRFVKPDQTGFLGSLSERLFTSKSAKQSDETCVREAMALLIGSLAHENDPATLNAIAKVVLDNPEQSATPLVSINKNAAVDFARAAGKYSGLSVLRLQHVTSVDDARWAEVVKEKGTDPTIEDIVAIVLRTGSPFEATAQLNQRFSSRDFLTTPQCPFRDLFMNQRALNTGSYLNDITRRSPPDSEEIDASLSLVIDSAATLERSSCEVSIGCPFDPDRRS